MPTKPLVGGHRNAQALDEVDAAFSCIDAEVRDALARPSLNPLDWIKAAGRVLGHSDRGRAAARELRAIHEQNKGRSER